MFQNLLEKVASELLKRKIPYIVIGGQALLVYGEPRLTRDIDITLGIGVEGLDRIKNVVKTLKLKYLISDVEDFVQETMVLPVVDEKSGIRIDFIFSFSPYEMQAIQRANEIKVGKTAVNFASLEDVVIHKIIARRARDIEDIKSILLKNPDYDSEYIRHWLAEFDRSLKENYMELFDKTVEELRTDS